MRETDTFDHRRISCNFVEIFSFLRFRPYDVIRVVFTHSFEISALLLFFFSVFFLTYFAGFVALPFTGVGVGFGGPHLRIMF